MEVEGKKKSKPSQVGVRERPSLCTLRVQKLRDKVVRTVPSVDFERAQLMTESWKKHESEPVIMRTVKAFRDHCQQRTIFIQDGELIVGTEGSVIRAAIVNQTTAWKYITDELDTLSTRSYDPCLITEDQKRLWTEFIQPYWEGKSVEEAWYARVPEEIDHLCDGLVFEHCTKVNEGIQDYAPDYAWVIKDGLNGIRKTIEEKLASLDAATPGNYDKITYLNALLIVCDGINTLAKRYAQLAEEMASQEREPQRRAELEKIAEICQWVPANPARTFWEALQSLWFYHVAVRMQTCASSNNPGRMDQYLYPYYKKDIEEGGLTKEQAQELLDCLWVKFGEVVQMYSFGSAMFEAGYSPFQNLCCGGVTAGGEDAVNELSYMMLQATMDVRLTQPALSVKYNKRVNPDSFLHKVAELVALGTGLPAIFNDEMGIKMMLNQGVNLEDAYNWNPDGCVQLNIMGKSCDWNASLFCNLGTAAELALLNGKYRLPKKRRYLEQPQTGDPRAFKTFDEFYAAVKTQLAYLIRKAVEAVQIEWSISEEMRPIPVVSLTFKDCIESARDWQCGGAKYNPGFGIPLVGIADIINSLVAVKNLIYDEKKLSWDELLEALADNFEGHEEIRQMCLSAPKYGNDTKEVNAIATDLFSSFIAAEFKQYAGAYGGRVVGGLYSVTSNVSLGKGVGALPSGRKAWTPLADNLSPMQGTDTKGPTAILKSVSKIDAAMYPIGTLVNLKFDPSLFKDESGIGRFMSLVKSQCDLGVYEIQCNVVSSETLREAQKYPEKYRGLMVRVAGYSAYFTELAKPVQDDIIARTTQMAWRK